MSIFCQLKATEGLTRAYTVDSVKLQVKNVGACRVFLMFFYIVYYFSSDEEPAGTGRGETKRAGPWRGLEVIP